jgi:Coenzyme PQQ synthesis protein D (PqqD)
VIAAGDRVSLAPGVHLAAGAIVDPVRGAAIPLNDTGRRIVDAVAGGATAGEAAEALAASYAVDRRRVELDVLAYCAELNARLLVNVRVRGGRVGAALRTLRALLVLGTIDVRTRRRAVDTRSGARAAVTAAAAVAPVAASLGILVATALLVPAAAAGVPAAAAAAGLAATFGVFAHEAAHAAPLRGVPACVATRALVAAVLHAPAAPARTRVSALAGPAVPAAAGLAVAAAAATPEAAAAAAALGVHAVGLLVAARDGRAACAAS